MKSTKTKLHGFKKASSYPSITRGGATMKSNVRKRSMCLPLVVTVALALVVPVAAGAQEIPPGDSTSLPDYIGEPAKAHPTANSGVPQNPYLAPNPFNSAHVDPWMSDVVDIAGPLGRNPEVLSSTLAEARRHSDSTIFQCVGAAFDSHGHLITSCAGTGPSGQENSVVLADARSLEVLAYYHLPTSENPVSALSFCYWYFDNRDRFTISAGPNRIITLVEGGSVAKLELEPQDDGYDLSGVVQDDDRIAGVMTDWQGRIWFVTAGVGEDTAKACVLNPATYPDVKCQPLGENDPTAGKHEKIFNTFAVTKTGAYVVTSKKMHRVWAGSDDDPYVVWSEPYATIDEVRPGQYELGSGTSPTILGEGKYVAITDNAEQLQVVVFRTDEKLDPGEQRVVCEVPVFDFPEGGAGAGSNSLVGLRNSIIAQNTADYLFDWETETLTTPGQPGIERIDIAPNGSGCTKVWTNQDVHTNSVVRLSTRNGLIYSQDRKYDAVNDVYAVYWAALDFRTGEVVWEKLAGTFARSGLATFDNFWAAIGIGPNGALYGANYAGVTMIKDTP